MTKIAAPALVQLFLDACTQNGFQDRHVPDDLLREIYDIAKMGATSMNCQPMHVVFLRTPAAKQRLAPPLSPTNLDKTMAAPVTAIIARDTQFYEFMPDIRHNPAARDMFANTPHWLRRPRNAMRPCRGPT